MRMCIAVLPMFVCRSARSCGRRASSSWLRRRPSSPSSPWSSGTHSRRETSCVIRPWRTIRARRNTGVTWVLTSRPDTHWRTRASATTNQNLYRSRWVCGSVVSTSSSSSQSSPLQTRTSTGHPESVDLWWVHPHPNPHPYKPMDLHPQTRASTGHPESVDLWWVHPHLNPHPYKPMDLHPQTRASTDHPESVDLWWVHPHLNLIPILIVILTELANYNYKPESITSSSQSHSSSLQTRVSTDNAESVDLWWIHPHPHPNPHPYKAESLQITLSLWICGEYILISTSSQF